MDKSPGPLAASPIHESDAAIKLRQGSILPRSVLSCLGLFNAEDADQDEPIYVVISHDCDIVRSRDLEPQVELIRGNRMEFPKSGFANGQSPRKLHIEFEQSGEKAILELSALQKVAVDKKMLIGTEPDPESILDTDGIAVLQGWLAARYRRAAFPTELDKRIEPIKKSLSAIDPRKIVGIWMLFDPEDDFLPDNMPYELSIKIVYNTRENGSKDYAEEKANSLRARFEKKFLVNGIWQSIDLRKCEEIADTVFSARDILEWKQWRLEHLSLSQDPPGEYL